MNYMKAEATISWFLGIVIGIVAGIILLYFAYQLFSLYSNQDSKNAESFIEDLSAKIGGLNDGESNTFALRGLDGWVLVGYNKSDLNRPDKCFFSSCVCVCKDSVLNCPEVGFCRSIDRDVTVSSKLQYLEWITGDNSRLTNISSSCIPGIDQLMGYLVNKNKDEISISYDYGYQEDEDWSGKPNKILDSLSKDGAPLGKLKENGCFIKQDIIKTTPIG